MERRRFVLLADNVAGLATAIERAGGEIAPPGDREGGNVAIVVLAPAAARGGLAEALRGVERFAERLRVASSLLLVPGRERPGVLVAVLPDEALGGGRDAVAGAAAGAAISLAATLRLRLRAAGVRVVVLLAPASASEDAIVEAVATAAAEGAQAVAAVGAAAQAALARWRADPLRHLFPEP